MTEQLNRTHFFTSQFIFSYQNASYSQRFSKSALGTLLEIQVNSHYNKSITTKIFMYKKKEKENL